MMPSMIDELVRIARAAGDEILDVYRSDFTVDAKADASPLTEADLRAHRCIVAGLGELRPGVADSLRGSGGAAVRGAATLAALLAG